MLPLERPRPALHAQLESRVADVARSRGFQTIGELAAACGLSRQVVASWWGRLPRWLHCYILAQLCAALHAQPADLIVLVDD